MSTAIAIILEPERPAQPLRAVPKRINLADESSLSWYFGQGQSAFSKSNFGAMLDRIIAGARISENCEQCQGTGVDIDSPGFMLIDDEPEMSASKRRGWCKRCRGQGSVERVLKHKVVNQTGYERCRPCRGSGCPICDGQGYTLSMPVFERKDDEPGGSEPDDASLTRHAVVSRRLDAVRVVNRMHYHVLATFYGDVGARWGRTQWGRIFALYSLTTAGTKLIRLAHERSNKAISLTPSERIGVEAEVEKTQPVERRRHLLDAAAHQAQQRYDEASEAWCNAVQAGK